MSEVKIPGTFEDAFAEWIRSPEPCQGRAFASYMWDAGLVAAQRENQRLREALTETRKIAVAQGWFVSTSGRLRDAAQKIDAALALTKQEKP